MKKALTSFLVFISMNSFSQDYQNICTQGKTIFLSTTSKYAAFRLDTAYNESGDSVYDSYFAFRDTSSISTWDCIDTTKGSIFGQKVVRHPDGTCYFKNRDNETIILNTASLLNQTWNIIAWPDNSYIEARVTDTRWETFLGVADSVKVIKLQFFDSFGNPADHIMNNKSFKLSKSYGLISFFDTYNFPKDTMQFFLAGKSDPVLGFQDPSAYDIYDWAVGSVLHYQDDGGLTNTGKNAGERAMGPPHYSYHTYTIKNIQQKNFFTDSVKYTCQICSLTTSGYSGFEDTTIVDKTVMETYIYDTAKIFFNKLPGEYNPYGYLYDLKIYGINNAPSRVVNEHAFFWSDNCWRFPQSPEHSIKTFSKNLGMTEEYSGNVYSYKQYKLVYFADGTHTSGTPLFADCSALLSIARNEIPVSQGIIFSPNPVERTALVEIRCTDDIKELTFCLYDMTGKRVNCQPVLNYSFLFDRENFAGGLYFYSLIDKEGKMLTSGKVMFR
jgi:hypothetical protein